MNMVIIFSIVSLFVGGFCCYLVLRPKLTQNEQIRTDIQEKNEELSKTNKELTDKQIELLSVNQNYTKENELLKQNNNELLKTFDTIKEQADKTSQNIYDQAMENIQEKMSVEAMEIGIKFQVATEEFQESYTEVMRDCAEEYLKYVQETTEELAAARSELDNLAGKIRAAVAANIREEEKKNNISFYTLGISELDVQEIKKLREVIPYLRNGRPINKAIWESYYRNATTDLINRIVGANTRTGIYKITCLLDNKTYIGQARNIGDRWKQHIKAGLGIDSTSNKLYTAMQKLGVENFTFEVIEECSSTQLNEREKYWIEYFQSNIYGFNMSSGGARN